MASMKVDTDVGYSTGHLFAPHDVARHTRRPYPSIRLLQSTEKTMRNRIAATVASVIVASLGTAAFAQQAPRPSQQPPTQQLPPQQSPQPPAQQPAQLPPPQQPQQPASAQASPAQVKRDVKSALAKDGITATKISVAVSAGTVTLTGSVYSKKDIAKAKAAAMTVAGVTSVDVSGLHSRTG